MGKIRLGVIGTWGHFAEVLRETENMPDVELVGLAPGTPGENTGAVAGKFPSARTYPDHRQLLSASRPDVVTVSTRLDRIGGLAEEAAESGCHLICEKPLALDIPGLQRLWRIVRQNRVQCLVMLNNRVHPVLAAARQAVAAGTIGPVRLLNARKSYRFGVRPEWFGCRELYGGTIPWIGIHALDFINSVTEAPFISVAAAHANLAHPERPGCEDVCIINLRLADGALATVSLDYMRPSGASSHGDDWLRVVGDKGVIEAAMSRGRCAIVTLENPEQELEPLAPTGYYAPWLRQLPPAGTAPPDEQTRRGFALTNAVLRAREAADRGSVLTVGGEWNGS